MKKILISATILAITGLLSCSKEESTEEQPLPPPPPETSWSFAVDAENYDGIVDRVKVEDVSGATLFTLEGSNTEAGSQLILALGTDALAPGTYTGPAAGMLFVVNGALVYQSNDTTDLFSIQLTAVTDSSVQGLFTGTVLDSTGASVSLSNGAFTANR